METNPHDDDEDFLNPSSSEGILSAVRSAMQNAEELGGPEGDDYLKLMQDIADEAMERHANYSAVLKQEHRQQNPEAYPMPSVEALADRFSADLRRTLGPESVARIVKLNAAEPHPSVCHAHDFTDANQVLLDSFEILTGRKAEVTLESEGDLLEAAYTLARQHHFVPDEQTLELSQRSDGSYAFTFEGMEIFNPTMSGCGRYETDPAEYGFQVWDTGGGCTAWGRKFAGDLQMMITAIDDASHEVSGGVCTIGVYEEREGEPLATYDVNHDVVTMQQQRSVTAPPADR